MFRELMTDEALVDLRLFRFSTYAAGVCVATLPGLVLYGSLVPLPPFMQELPVFSAEQAGIWSARLVDQVTAYNPDVERAIHTTGSLLTGGRVTGVSTLAGLDAIAGQVQQQAAAMAFIDMFYMVGILILCAPPAIWFMRRPDRGKGEVSVH